MKIKLTCYYAEHNPGDVIEVDDEEGIRLIELANGAVAVPDEDEAEDGEPAKPAKGKKKGE